MQASLILWTLRVPVTLWSLNVPLTKITEMYDFKESLSQGSQEFFWIKNTWIIPFNKNIFRLFHLFEPKHRYWPFLKVVFYLLLITLWLCAVKQKINKSTFILLLAATLDNVPMSAFLPETSIANSHTINERRQKNGLIYHVSQPILNCPLQDK